MSRIVLLICLTAVTPLLAKADPHAPALVVSTGTAQTQLSPRVLRVRVDVFGLGNSVPDAARALDARCERARSDAIRMGANPRSVHVSLPRRVVESSEVLESPETIEPEAPVPTLAIPPGPLETVVSPATHDSPESGGLPASVALASADGVDQAAAAAGAAVAGADVPEEVRVTAQLVADFELGELAGGDLLVSVERLQQQILAADLSGVEALERERAARALAADPSGLLPAPPCLCGQGRPVFSFVAPVTEAVREQLAAAAVAQAKRGAGRLARASGGRLGELVRLTESETHGLNPSASVNETPGATTPAAIEEVEGSNLEPLSAAVSVQAAYELQRQPGE